MGIIQLSLFDSKQCLECGELKSLNEFYLAKRHNDRLIWYARCKECTRKKTRAYALANPDQTRAYKRKHSNMRYRSDAEYRKQHNEYNRCYYQNNRERLLVRASEYAQRPEVKARIKQYAEDTREQMREWRRNWRKKNRARYLLHKYRRRQLERMAEGEYTDSQWRTLLSICNERCLACGSTSQLTVDHIVPLSRGGSNEITNIQPLCFRCNSGKSGRHSTDYRTDTVRKWALNEVQRDE